MTKQLDFNSIMYLIDVLNKNWTEEMKKTSLSTRSLYNLVSLKKKLEAKAVEIQETAFSIVLKHGGSQTENGGVSIGEAEAPEANKELSDLTKEKTEIEYSEIVLTEKDSLSPLFMEVLYDFIIFE